MSQRISAEEVEKSCTLKEAVASQRKVFAALISGEAVMGPRAVIPNGDDAQFAYIARASLHGPTVVKFGSVNPGNAKKGIPVVQTEIAVLDAVTGELIYFVDGESVTRIRTTAASMVAAELLANSIKKIAIIGAGHQGVAHAHAALELFSPEQITLVSRSAAEKVRALFPASAPIKISNDVDLACSEADLIFVSTNSNTPVVSAALKPGTTCISIGAFAPNREEVSPALLARADKVFGDHGPTLQEQCGSIVGAMKISDRKWSSVISIGEVINGSAKGRTSPDEIIFYFSIGLGIQDAALIENILDSRA